MAYIGTHAELNQAEMTRLETLILTALKGEASTPVANACLLVGIAICIRGGATKDQIKDVLNGMVDAFKGERSN